MDIATKRFRRIAASAVFVAALSSATQPASTADSAHRTTATAASSGIVLNSLTIKPITTVIRPTSFDQRDYYRFVQMRLVFTLPEGTELESVTGSMTAANRLGIHDPHVNFEFYNYKVPPEPSPYDEPYTWTRSGQQVTIVGALRDDQFPSPGYYRVDDRLAFEYLIGNEVNNDSIVPPRPGAYLRHVTRATASAARINTPDGRRTQVAGRVTRLMCVDRNCGDGYTFKPYGSRVVRIYFRPAGTTTNKFIAQRTTNADGRYAFRGAVRRDGTWTVELRQVDRFTGAKVSRFLG